MPKKKQMQKNTKKNTKKSSSNEISSDDLAILGAGFTVIGDFFELLSLLKLKEEQADGTEQEIETEDIVIR